MMCKLFIFLLLTVVIGVATGQSSQPGSGSAETSSIETTNPTLNSDPASTSNGGFSVSTVPSSGSTSSTLSSSSNSMPPPITPASTFRLATGVTTSPPATTTSTETPPPALTDPVPNETIDIPKSLPTDATTPPPGLASSGAVTLTPDESITATTSTSTVPVTPPVQTPAPTFHLVTGDTNSPVVSVASLAPPPPSPVSTGTFTPNIDDSPVFPASSEGPAGLSTDSSTPKGDSPQESSVPRTPDPTFRLVTGDTVNPAPSTPTDAAALPPSTAIPVVATLTEAPVAIPDTSSNSPTVPTTAAPRTPDPTFHSVTGDTASPATTTALVAPTSVSIAPHTPNTIPVIPPPATPAPRTSESTFHMTTSPLSPSTITTSGSTPTRTPTAISTTPTSSFTPQPTFRDSTSGVTLGSSRQGPSSDGFTNTAHSASSRGEKQDPLVSSGQQEPKSTTESDAEGNVKEVVRNKTIDSTRSPRATSDTGFNDIIDAQTSSSGSFWDVNAGDNSTGSSIEFGSSSTETPNEIGSEDTSQASDSKANSGVRVTSVASSALSILAASALFF